MTSLDTTPHNTTEHNTTEHNATEDNGAARIGDGPRHANRADHPADMRRDSIIDPGDVHEKGEQSLCVGEAA